MNLLVVNFLHMQTDPAHLAGFKKSKIGLLVDYFNSVFAKDKFDVGKFTDHEACVCLTEHKYIFRKPYKCNIID